MSSTEMDVLLLGAAAIVLIGLTVWIVWRPPHAAEQAETGTQAAATIPPAGDAFEDQYTSATADLSAGGVAVATAEHAPPVVVEVPSSFQRAGEPWQEPALARERAIEVLPAAPLQLRERGRPQAIGLGAAALLTIGGAVGGAILYARWQQTRNRPINRLRRLLK